MKYEVTITYEVEAEKMPRDPHFHASFLSSMILDYTCGGDYSDRVHETDFSIRRIDP